MSAGGRKSRYYAPRENSREVNSNSIWVGTLAVLIIVGILLGVLITLLTGGVS